MKLFAALILGVSSTLTNAANAEVTPPIPVLTELVRAAMQSHLKDADSAKFRNVRTGTNDQSHALCGQVNAKNSYGAYMGYVSFIGYYIAPENYKDSDRVKHDPSVLLLHIDDGESAIAEEMCKKSGL